MRQSQLGWGAVPRASNVQNLGVTRPAKFVASDAPQSRSFYVNRQMKMLQLREITPC